MAQLRMNGVDDLAEVKTATLESNGEISIIAFDKDNTKDGNGNDGRTKAAG
ncbi:hypothetical protein BH24ACI3_BH24ACI3_09310 [soil metagenome]